MKKILILAIILFAGNMFAQKVEWMTMNEALEAQQFQAKPIMVDAYTTWCGPCKLLDRNTFGNTDVAAFINKHYYPVKFNAEGTEDITYLNNDYTNPNYDPSRRGRNSQHEFAQAMKLRGYPSIVFFDEAGNYIQPVVGYKTPRQLEIYLKMIANGDYKELTTQEKWQAYQDNFKYEFAGK